ncbi:MAG: HEAT repeat domain-containing protein, partial [Planctomycetia bacterium]
NIPRYFQVLRSIALRETTVKREKRIKLLQEQLLDPVKSRAAALQLEAIGKHGIDALKHGLSSQNTEVRFRSAEALAYLGEQEAAKVLSEVARNEPAFRVFALAALGVMKDDYEAADALKDLLGVPSVETRYGAFRMLSEMHRLKTEYLGEQFHYCVLPSSHEKMIHVTNSRRPEIVLFGEDQKILTPCLLKAGPRIRISSDGGNEISISRFGGNQLDQKRIVKNQVDDVIRAIVELEGTYPDVVQVLQDAKAKNLLPSRFEVDALPDAGRTYHRKPKTVEPYKVEEKPPWWKKVIPAGFNKEKEEEPEATVEDGPQTITTDGTTITDESSS